MGVSLNMESALCVEELGIRLQTTRLKLLHGDSEARMARSNC